MFFSFSALFQFVSFKLWFKAFFLKCDENKVISEDLNTKHNIAPLVINNMAFCFYFYTKHRIAVWINNKNSGARADSKAKKWNATLNQKFSFLWNPRRLSLPNVPSEVKAARTGAIRCRNAVFKETLLSVILREENSHITVVRMKYDVCVR